MTEKFPRLNASQIIKVIERRGFILVRQSGSHMIYKNASGARVTVSFHGAKILHRKILRNILGDADLDITELKALL